MYARLQARYIIAKVIKTGTSNYINTAHKFTGLLIRQSSMNSLVTVVS
jgi:hypothetical protein